MAVGELVTRKGVTFSAKIRTTTIQVTGASGTFEYGETVTGGTSSATGKVAYYSASDSEIQLFDVSGTFDASETLTGGTSGATASADGAASTAYGTSWVTIARVRDSFNLSRTRPVTEIVDFDSDEAEFTDKIAGNQSANVAFTINLVPGGTSFQLLEAAMDDNMDIAVKRVQTDREADDTRTRYYVGVVSNFSETDSVTDASTVAVTIELSDVSLTDPTT